MVKIMILEINQTLGFGIFIYLIIYFKHILYLFKKKFSCEYKYVNLNTKNACEYIFVDIKISLKNFQKNIIF